MICVIEYGENIGTLRNLFPDIQQALVFAKQIIALSEREYECIGPNQWYCQDKKNTSKSKGLQIKVLSDHAFLTIGGFFL